MLLSLSGFAQDKDRKERIKALKIAFITERLELTEKEAQKFWPVYNDFEETYYTLKRDMRSHHKTVNPETLDEAGARQLIDEMIAQENKKTELKKNFMSNLLNIIPAKKVIQLKMAEDDFNRRMLDEYRKRRDSNKKE